MAEYVQSNQNLETPEAGKTLHFTVEDVPALNILPKGIVPQWSSSTDQAEVVPADDGLSADVKISDRILNNTKVVITVRATLPSGKTISGNTDFTIGLPSGPEIVAFKVERTA